MQSEQQNVVFRGKKRTQQSVQKLRQRKDKLLRRQITQARKQKTRKTEATLPFSYVPSASS